MQDPTDNRDVAIAVAPDPLDQLVKRVRVGGITNLADIGRSFLGAGQSTMRDGAC